MNLKRTPADIWFSNCVRIRTNWTCEYAGTIFENNRQGLDCSHYISRGNWSVRFDPFNAFAHSMGSHSYIGRSDNRQLFVDWVVDRIGEEEHRALIMRSVDTKLGKEYRKANKLKEGRSTALAAHFKREFERMNEMRMDGCIDRLEFKSFIG